MACNCGTSSCDCKRRYMRIDGVIFDKKYVSKLVFYDKYFSLFFKGDCKEFKFPLSTPKTPNQIAEYQLELNSCDDQVDMSTDDHSKLINLDLDGQHPISAVINLQESLDEKLNVSESYWIKDTVFYNNNEYSYEYNTINPKEILLNNTPDISNVAELFIAFTIAIANSAEIPDISPEDIKIIKSSPIKLKTVYGSSGISSLFSDQSRLLIGFCDGITYEFGLDEKTYKILNTLDVIDSLEKQDFKLPLSANQGYILNNKIKNKQDSIKQYLYSNLPLASDYKNNIYFCTDLNCLAYSDGNKWFKISLEEF